MSVCRQARPRGYSACRISGVYYLSCLHSDPSTYRWLWLIGYLASPLRTEGLPGGPDLSGQLALCSVLQDGRALDVVQMHAA
jgi:hypothetical protein